MLPRGTQDAAYSADIAASGGSGTYRFSASGLPFGMTIDSAGQLSGTLSAAPGLWQLSLTVTDAANPALWYTKRMAIPVAGAPSLLPSIRPYGGDFDDCTFATPCTLGVNVFGGGVEPSNWDASGLPTGLSLRWGSGTTSTWVGSGDAEIWGAATEVGVFNVQLTVTDATGASVTQTFPLGVSTLAQSGANGGRLTNGTIDVPYTSPLRVIGGLGPYAASPAAGRLPAGLVLGSDPLVATGTPLESGWFHHVLTFTDSQGHSLRSFNGVSIESGSPGVSINHDGNLGTRATDSFLTDQLFACVAQDDVAGLVRADDASFSLMTDVDVNAETAAAETETREVCDADGNCAAATAIGGHMVDRKAPVITISSPRERTSYLLNEAVRAAFECNDSGSGVASCEAISPGNGDLPTESIGSREFTVKAADRVGNAADVRVSYHVTYAVVPLQDEQTAMARGGRLPIMVRIVDALGTNVSSSAIGLVSQSMESETGGRFDLDEPFRFDSIRSAYTLNLDTAPLEPGTYRLSFSVNGDPVGHTVGFRIR